MKPSHHVDPGYFVLHWTPEEALAFTDFLAELIAAIWNLRGPEMALVVRRRVAEQQGRQGFTG